MGAFSDQFRTDLEKNESLENNNYKVRTAHNGKEGLEKVKKGKPGLILLDLMMPEMDGFEFSEKLRQNKEWLDIPVVVITAKDLTKEDHARLSGNVETIMQKGSYSKKELMDEVSEILCAGLGVRKTTTTVTRDARDAGDV